MERYDVVRRIGGGSCGSVYLVRQKKPDGELLIVKKISLNTIDVGVVEQAGAEAHNEVKVLQTSEHTNIVAIEEAFLTEEHLCIVSDKATIEYKQKVDTVARRRSARLSGRK